jgi:uncharacterized membrane-anchored protein
MSHWEETAATAKAEVETSSNDGGLLCARVTVSALFDLESIWLFRRRHNSPGWYWHLCAVCAVLRVLVPWLDS